MRFLFLLLALAGTPLLAQNCGDDCGSISGLNWLDENRDGIRQDSESLTITEVKLYGNDGSTLISEKSEFSGEYTFTDLPPGDYTLEFEPPGGFAFYSTLSKQGSDPARDSDATDVNEGEYNVQITLGAGQEINTDADVGWIVTESPSVRTVREATCANPTGAVEVIIKGRAPAIIFVDGQPVPRTGEATLLDSLTPGGHYLEISLGKSRRLSNGTLIYEAQSVQNIFVSEPFPVEVIKAGSECIDPTLVRLAVAPIDSSSFASYEWSDGSTDSVVRQPVVGESYSVTVTLDDGCQATSEFPYRVRATPYTFPQDSIIRLDCVTGLATIALPESISQAVEFRLRPPDAGRGDPASEFTVDKPGFYSLSPGPGSSCAVSGEFEVLDDRLTGMVLRQERIDSCLLDANNLFVSHPTTTDFSKTHTFNFRGPADSIVPDPQKTWFADLYGALPGLYFVDVTSECGDTTLSTLVVAADTCEFISNVSGLVYLNNDGLCDDSSNSASTAIPRANVSLTNDGGTRNYLFQTDDDGYWEGRIVPDTYRITVLTPRDSSLVACPSSRSFYTFPPGLVAFIPLAMIEVTDCASLSVDVVSPRFRVCFENKAYVSYANRGGQMAENALLRVTVDPLFEEVTATQNFTRSGDVLTFDLSDLPALGRGQLQLGFKVSCESIRGQLHCLKAEISSDNDCNPGTGRALLDVTAAPCDGDSLRFNITNVGTVAMSSDLEYFVYVDAELDENESKRVAGLAAGQNLGLTFPATGATVQVVARQATMGGIGSAYPSAIVEGCGGIMIGAGVQISSDNGFAGRSIYCRINTGSFDPNEKRVFPTGLGDLGDVPPGTRLTYELHFQNTGTDTAFTVVIRDVLPAELDVATIEFGASSHDYDVMIDDGRVLTFTFNDILLVDSFTNVAGSMGVVSFSIDHVETLERGDEFQNRAGIYFDFNEPVITEFVRTRIVPLPSLINSLVPEFRNFPVRIELFPNPVGNELQVELPDLNGPVDVSLRVINVFGQTAGTYPYFKQGDPIDVSALPVGTYVLVAQSGGHVIGRKQFVVAR
ncbi:DUF7619 domain-containing protein [Neolewinella antarctica]|uniref:Repeat protein (TIGR01451 family) n=1 Tax=Neolewinella antarctica TaxID=442734 RepID=A0ABX0XAC8_9BACT|nr:SdrD B-like domain-containing protein [Neolewinella antarctica]NJC25773.1 putative repeat protein (TIGR01451 family) [Neolewinella antarctica]